LAALARRRAVGDGLRMAEPDRQAPESPLAELRTSARGWQSLQLAVIGFIGLCGVLQDGRPDNPKWIQVWAGLLALVALVLALIAMFVVARVAWPLYGGREPALAEAEAVSLEGRRLRMGLVLTVASLAALALGTASGWWPQSEEGGGDLVAVQAADGQSWCGALGEAAPGALRIEVEGAPVVVSLDDVAALGPVDSC
jgi:hypothetical protein